MTDQRATSTPDQIRRPVGITCLVLIIALIGLYHLLRFSQVLLNWKVLAGLNPLVSPAYLAGDGLAWFLISAILAWGLWVVKPWARTAGQITSVLYCLSFWGNKLWILSPDDLLRRWPADLVLSMIGLGLVLVILNHKSSRLYFDKNPVKIT
jgi:hypothetical protein